MDSNTEPQRITLNGLLEEQQSLNMRMLLAVQLRDFEAQEELRSALEEVARKIDCMRSGSLRH